VPTPYELEQGQEEEEDQRTRSEYDVFVQCSIIGALRYVTLSTK
jgi:hypothetical protein